MAAELRAVFLANGKIHDLVYEIMPYPVTMSEEEIRERLSDPFETLTDAKKAIVQRIVDSYPDASNIKISLPQRQQRQSSNSGNGGLLIMVAIVIGVLLAPFLLTVAMFGELMLKGTFNKKVRSIKQYKSFRKALLEISYIWFVLCVVLFIVFNFVEKLDVVGMIPFFALFFGNIAFIIIAIVRTKKIEKEHPEVEEPVEVEKSNIGFIFLYIITSALIAPIIMPFAMFGFIFKSVFGDALNIDEYKKSRRTFLVAFYSWIAAYTYSFVVFYFVGPEVPIVSFFAFNFIMALISVFMTNGIIKKQNGEEDAAKVEIEATQDESVDVTAEESSNSEYEKFLASLDYSFDEDELDEEKEEVKEAQEPTLMKRNGSLIALSVFLIYICAYLMFCSIDLFHHSGRGLITLFALIASISVSVVSLALFILSLIKIVPKNVFIALSSIGLTLSIAFIPTLLLVEYFTFGITRTCCMMTSLFASDAVFFAIALSSSINMKR